MGNFGRIAGKAFNYGMPVVGGFMDYQSGKEQGEDDIRAGAGAVGSTLGGLAATGAATAAGAKVGAALGTALAPGVGTLAGGAIGGLAGLGTSLATQGLGGFAGGWTADRLDEAVRGKNTGVKNKMSQYVQDQRTGDIAEVDDNGNIVGWIVKGGVVVAGGNTVLNIGNELKDIPYDYARNKAIFQADPLLNATPEEAARWAAREVPGDIGRAIGRGFRTTGNNIGRVWNAIPGNNVVKAGAALALVGDQLTGANLSKGVGRVLAGGADAVANTVGFNTDFDGRNRMSQQQIKQNNETARVEDNLKIYNPYDEAIYQQGFRSRQEMEDYENRIWQRNEDKAAEVFKKRDDINRRNYMTEFTAKQASDLLSRYAEMPQSVANSIAQIYQAAR